MWQGLHACFKSEVTHLHAYPYFLRITPYKLMKDAEVQWYENVRFIQYAFVLRQIYGRL